MLVAPRYGQASLADLLPSVLATLGVPDETDRIGLGLDDIDHVCVLLVDGLGAELLTETAGAAPFLSAASATELTVGFPSTTATSLSSLGTGTPPGEHGIVGYLLRVPGHNRLMNPLKWRLHGPGEKVDLLKDIVPEQFQPTETAFERAAAHGISMSRVGPMYQAASGLTRASLRGGDFRPSFSMGDLADGIVTALTQGDRSLVYAYHGELDLTGHVRGPRSQAWALELAQVDHMVSAVAQRLPPRSALLVTGDHGMVHIADPVDFDTTPVLSAGVAQLGGEPRARHVYVADGAIGDVTAAWRETLGSEFAVLTRAEAVANGWFGPTVTDRTADRIGDLVTIALGNSAIIRSGAEPLQSALVGHHGSLTPAEMLVPLSAFR